ncbi:MAG: hypothetical protein KF902_08135 [Phycisphaeraceae bacterium]|nr:hypothetical protein [Phycisphaeraceae bacterium]
MAGFCIIDLFAVLFISFSSNSVTLPTILVTGGGGSSKPMLIEYFDSPSGVWAVQQSSPAMERLTDHFGTFPPPGWKKQATVWFSMRHLQPIGFGLLLPAVSQSVFEVSVIQERGVPLTSDAVTRIRSMFCDWLATESEWASPATAAYAAELRTGDHIARRIIWPFLVHDIVVVCAIAWSSWTLLRVPPVLLRRRARLANGRCPGCDYDLIAKFETGCPECGWGKEP